MVADDPEAPILRQFAKRDDAVQSVSLWQAQASDPRGVVAAVKRGDATLLDSYGGDQR
jgi:hypothetical protein